MRIAASGLFAVITAGLLAFSSGADGKGALLLWPLFGTVNQLLACLTLLVLTNYLKQKGGRRYLATAIPFVIMLIITIWAIVFNEIKFIKDGKIFLCIINFIIMILASWIIVEGVILLVRKKR